MQRQRSYLHILASLVCALLPAVILPWVLLRLWDQAIILSGFRGGMWYSPTTPLEWLFAGGFLISILPFLISLIISLVPAAWFVQLVGLHVTLIVPFTTPAIKIDLPFAIAGSIALGFQIVVWSIIIEHLYQRWKSWTSSQPWSHE